MKKFSIKSTLFLVKKVSMDLSMWSGDEMLYTNTSSVFIQYKSPQTRSWISVRNFLDGSLPYDRATPLTCTVNFPNEVQEFRIYATSLQSGTNNKGRICVGEVRVN